MITSILDFLQTINDPHRIVPICFFFVASYYLISAPFHYFARKGASYTGMFRTNGPLDIITSVLWCSVAVLLLLSLPDLLIRDVLSLTYLLAYYALFLFLFAFVYNLFNRHFAGTITGLNGGWAGELQCITMSLQAMTTADYTSAKPARIGVEFIAAIQSLLGILFVAIFIARTVEVLNI